MKGVLFMKKLFAFALVLVLCFSFAACTVEEEPDSSSSSAVASTVSSSNSTVVSTVKNEETPVSPSSSAIVSTVKNEEKPVVSSSSSIVSTITSSSTSVVSTVTSSSSSVVSTVKNSEKIEDIIKTQDATLESIREAFKDMMTIELEARGNSIVYKYTYIINTGDADILKDSLDNSIKTQEETLKNSLTLMRTSIPEMESIIVEYYDINKKLIASYEFK